MLSSGKHCLYSIVRNCLVGYDKLLLSYSGGLDSTVLLDLITKLMMRSALLSKTGLPISLRAVYIHHKLSNNADIWADHCAQQCRIRNIPFQVAYVYSGTSVQNITCNIEAWARELRYQKLYDCLNSEEVLLTGHHMDDQVETTLLALKRGSGPSGLSGMIASRYTSINNRHCLLRPLLNCSKKQLQMYASKNALSWVEDETNMNMRFDRNFLRVQIIPLLYKRWPNFHKVALRTAQLCRNQEDLLYELLSESLISLMHSDGSLYFHPLLKYSPMKRQALLRYWLKNFFLKMPSYQLLNRLWKEVVLSKVDANPILQLEKKYICRRFHKRLYILPSNMKLPIKIPPLHWNTESNIILLPYELGLLSYSCLSLNQCNFEKRCDKYIHLHSSSNIFFKKFKDLEKILTNCLVRPPKINENVSIRFGHAHGLLHLINRNHGRKLKKIWQEFNIPPWLRSRIPLLFYNDTLISAIGVFITKSGYSTISGEVKNQNHTLWNIMWFQKSLYYKLYKDSIFRFLK